MIEGACVADVVDGRAKWHVAHADCRFALAGMPDACVDSVVCDPPYELRFMGKKWDESGIAYDAGMWREVLRVLKPGGHLLAFGGTRTYHRMACAIEDAGFEIRDSIHWVYATGFPKSLDVSKAIDGAAGAERNIVGPNPTWREAKRTNAIMEPVRGGSAEVITSPATDAARQWSGWGTALKPAHEPIVVARKPLAGTVATNVLAHGTGGLNVDGCRVGYSGPDDLRHTERKNAHGDFGTGPRANAIYGEDERNRGNFDGSAGRWPPNLLLTHSIDCDMDGECSGDCPVAEMDRQSGERPGMSGGGTGARDLSMFGVGGVTKPETVRGDTGGASRFFPVFRFEPKASTSEREAGLDHLPLRTAGELTGREDGADGLQSPRAGAGRASNGRRNIHPTVKPIALLAWLCRLVTPPKGLVLDPFAGSGTGGCACMNERFRYIGLELGADHTELARHRIRHHTPRQRDLFLDA